MQVRIIAGAIVAVVVLLVIIIIMTVLILRRYAIGHPRAADVSFLVAR